MNVLDWAGGAEIGQRVAYAELNLGEAFALRRGADPRVLGTALQAHYAGLVFLAQRRRPGKIVYEATRISRPTALRLGLVEAPL